MYMIAEFFAQPLVAALLVSLAINSALFLVAYRLQSDKLTDISYAATFATIAVFAFVLSDKSLFHTGLLVMVVLWALRLGSFLLYRVMKTGKDARFDEMRHSFFKFGKFWLAQALTVWVVMIASVLAFDAGQPRLEWLALIGIAVWIVGLVCETIADVQKFAFTQRSANKNKWIASGIWKYSRHPNYFGEMAVWIGIYTYVVSSLPGFQPIIALVSPLLIVVLLIFVSGIPILEKSAEKRWGSDPAYQRYKKRTSLLVPWPQKNNPLD